MRPRLETLASLDKTVGTTSSLQPQSGRATHPARFNPRKFISGFRGNTWQQPLLTKVILFFSYRVTASCQVLNYAQWISRKKKKDHSDVSTGVNHGAASLLSWF